MWIYNEQGYLVYIDKPRVQLCKMCGESFQRDIEICEHQGNIFDDACPNCGKVYNQSDRIRFNNVLVNGVACSG